MNLSDMIMAGKEQLVMNGAGLRKKLFVKVYAGGFYLKKKKVMRKRLSMLTNLWQSGCTLSMMESTAKSWLMRLE